MPWYAITDPQDPKLDELAIQFHLHPLHVEDCRAPHERAKAERDSDYLFVILNIFVMPNAADVTFASLCIFVGKEFLITVCDNQCASAGMLERAQRAEPDAKPGKLFYLIFDAVVDAYLPAVDKFGEHIDDLQDRVLEDPRSSVLHEIFGHKRDLAQMRRMLVHTRDVCLFVQRDADDLTGKHLRPYFRDIYDHIARNLDAVELERDLLTNTLDVYLSSVANRTNEVMKVLTVLSTIALPCLVISSIYGMNIKGIPFLDSEHGIEIVTGMMAMTTVVLLVMLKKFRWL